MVAVLVGQLPLRHEHGPQLAARGGGVADELAPLPLQLEHFAQVVLGPPKQHLAVGGRKQLRLELASADSGDTARRNTPVVVVAAFPVGSVSVIFPAVGRGQVPHRPASVRDDPERVRETLVPLDLPRIDRINVPSVRNVAKIGPRRKISAEQSRPPAAESASESPAAERNRHAQSIHRRLLLRGVPRRRLPPDLRLIRHLDHAADFLQPRALALVERRRKRHVARRKRQLRAGHGLQSGERIDRVWAFRQRLGERGHVQAAAKAGVEVVVNHGHSLLLRHAHGRALAQSGRERRKELCHEWLGCEGGWRCE